MLFGIPAVRDGQGSAGLDPEGILNRSIRAVKDRVGDDLPVMSDLCLDEFTDHGHCGVLDDAGQVDNDATLEIYGQMGAVQAEAGADVVALRDDGRPGRRDPPGPRRGRPPGCPDPAYAAKYASAYYGPFREAVDSQLKGDRRQYQMDAPNRTEALREVELDLAEGATW